MYHTHTHIHTNIIYDFPVGTSGKEPACQCRRRRRRKRHGLDPWVGKRRRRKWQPAPVFLLTKFHRQRSLLVYNPWGLKESVMTEDTIIIFVEVLYPLLFNFCLLF